MKSVSAMPQYAFCPFTPFNHATPVAQSLVFRYCEAADALWQAKELRSRIIHDPAKEQDQKFKDLILRLIRDDATIEALNFSVGAWWLRPGDVGKLSDALKINRSVRELDLGGQGLGPDSGPLLCGALFHNTSLTALHLGGNKLANSGVTSLAEALVPHQETAERVDEQACSPHQLVSTQPALLW